MGSGASVLTEIPKDWLNIFKAMKLKNSEVRKLYDMYNTVDADRSGSIDVVELLMFLDIERTLFTERIFEAFDKDHTHRIDFYEFVVSVWKFCTLGKEATPVFAFDLYDTNADGRLSTKDVHTMFRELLGSKAMEQESTQRAIADLLKEEINDHIGVESFRIFIRMHQALLFNVFGIQNKLRITTLGIRSFEKLSKRRIEIRPGCTVPLSDLMILHSHRKMFFDILSDQTVLRVSSMMRIVLDNTDNALHKTPPPSPRISPLEHTKILSPFPMAASTFGPSPVGHGSPARPLSPAMSPPGSARTGHRGSVKEKHGHHVVKAPHEHEHTHAHGHGHGHAHPEHHSDRHGHGHDHAHEQNHAHAPQPHLHLHLLPSPPVPQTQDANHHTNAYNIKHAANHANDDPLLHQSVHVADQHVVVDTTRHSH